MPFVNPDYKGNSTVSAGEIETDIILTAEPHTDLYRRPGKIFDNAPRGLIPATGDFKFQAGFTATYEEEYQQAGLCLYNGPEEWIKAGVERYDGKPRTSVVVNRKGGWSDWSVSELVSKYTVGLDVDSPSLVRIVMRFVKTGETIQVELLHGVTGKWELVRKTYGWDAEVMNVGLMAASPGDLGLTVKFQFSTLDPALARVVDPGMNVGRQAGSERTQDHRQPSALVFHVVDLVEEELGNEAEDGEEDHSGP
ncbi:uncharacterized protein EV422DRAFT_523245 [Fimicolochytrium jonesii]|uniref:uncharacterized protein n=1 Tax=Fimicolochytrium jonesii TaxID=1396493 RepID=UPI0022FE3E7F|nr:uncharacterized protein EV422DRAFT_523245 [Fimicolochytrium jonesii]KAI8823072.1 hypothetical protein EV422DRAFT_523245 [Fimicolochytrium jonesii]